MRRIHYIYTDNTLEVYLRGGGAEINRFFYITDPEGISGLVIEPRLATRVFVNIFSNQTDI